jgi:hypothetical protein
MAFARQKRIGLPDSIQVLLGLAACLCWFPPARCRAAEAKLEYEVKAAFLLNFTKFIEWPPAAFISAEAPLTICVLGDDPFGNSLDQVVAGESVSGRRLAVQRIKGITPKACQVLYVSKSEKEVPGILSALGPGVLTVSDREGFLREGGMIGFVIEGRRVRFDINLHAASRASLAISSRLLSVARSVQK